ncbi:MAG: nicotinate-nucleotide adenylyltransferase [Lachnospiraceae bacterium]|nr:nicotinate-nucleotide adenylyltransferase [Lachnospiraceae bacterium]
MGTRKKIGIMGGTFDPVHIAHLVLAENAYRAFGLDSVIILPSGHPAYKITGGREISCAEHRLAMLEEACRDIPYFRVSDMEIKREGNTYSADTLEILTRENPDTDYYFIIGGDSLIKLDTWHDPASLLKNCIIVAAVRDVAPIQACEEKAADLRERFGARIEFMDIPQLDISSTEIRRRVHDGLSVKYLVPAGAEEYIKEHGLYL